MRKAQEGLNGERDLGSLLLFHPPVDQSSQHFHTETIPMRKSYSLVWFGFMAALWMVGCSSKPPTVRITGKITVNGKVPNPPVQLEAKFTGIESPGRHPVKACQTDPTTGMFRFSTYTEADGVPPGKYALLMTSRRLNPTTNEPEGDDLLGGKYDSVEESPQNINIPDDAADMGLVENGLGTINLVSGKSRKR